jgi:hypothetical protein
LAQTARACDAWSTLSFRVTFTLAFVPEVDKAGIVRK